MQGRLNFKTKASLLFTLLSLLSLSIPAHAEAGEPIGNFPADTVVSSTKESEAEDTDGGESFITLSDGYRYGEESHMFYRTVEKSDFCINIPDGAILTGTVSAQLSPSLIAVLYKNGNEVQDADISCITAPGKYVLAVTENDVSKTVRASFTIVNSPTGMVSEYKMPADFYVASATMNGESASYSRSYVDLSVDGDYKIEYCSPVIGKTMELSVTIDHTAPTAVLEGITDGKANGPVTVSGVEEGTSVYLFRNGKQVGFTGTISETGAYSLTLRDAAGNETAYDFVVVTYANTSLKVLIATAAVLVLALGAYLLYYRRYYRVS